MARLLGATLILGGILVSGVVGWVLNSYRQEAQLADGWLILIGLFVAITLVLPQLGLGIYLLREAGPPKEGE